MSTPDPPHPSSIASAGQAGAYQAPILPRSNMAIGTIRPWELLIGMAEAITHFRPQCITPPSPAICPGTLGLWRDLKATRQPMQTRRRLVISTDPRKAAPL